MMDANLPSSTAMSASESSVKLVVKFSIRRKSKPDEVFCPAEIEIVKTVSGRRRMHDSNINLASAPSVEGLSCSKNGESAKLFGRMLEYPFYVVNESISYDNRLREAFQQLKQGVELSRVYMVPLMSFIVDSSIRHLQELPPQHAGIDGGDLLLSNLQYRASEHFAVSGSFVLGESDGDKIVGGGRLRVAHDEEDVRDESVDLLRGAFFDREDWDPIVDFLIEELGEVVALGRA